MNANDIINNPGFENFIRAFWRRIDAYKNDYSKELPEKLPVEFRSSMETALIAIDWGNKHNEQV